MFEHSNKSMIYGAEGAAMRAMFRARKEVFIDLLGWDLPVLAGEYELDQFDGPGAEYVILTDRDGAHRASARLLPTDTDHLLSACFPMLCAAPPPSGPAVREITRFCLSRHHRGAARRLARNQLVTALAEYGLAHDLTGFTGVAAPAWSEQIMTFGWRCKPLGPVVSVAGQALVAIHIEIDGDTIAGLKRTGVYEPPRRPEQPSAVAQERA